MPKPTPGQATRYFNTNGHWPEQAPSQPQPWIVGYICVATGYWLQERTCIDLGEI